MQGEPGIIQCERERERERDTAVNEKEKDKEEQKDKEKEWRESRLLVLLLCGRLHCSFSGEATKAKVFASCGRLVVSHLV